tara:strand:- start:4113 stop:4889 length:777 start_codon:yes stop_codon:yes gene_type:complete
MGSTPPNPFLSIIVFIILTITYFIIKYILQIKKIATNYLFGVFMIYIGTLIITELMININLTNSLCGSNQWQTAFLVTAVPWILIFGLLNILLMLFPGWLIPFSNTFGYGIAKLGGLNNLLNKILKPQDATGSPQLTKALADIYTDRTLLINEIGISNFDTFWNSLRSGQLLSKDANNNLKDELKNFVYLKTIVAEFMWFLLTGILTTSASYNYIINSACNQSVKDMQRRHEEYQKEVDSNIQANKEAPPDRVYSTFE